MQIQNHKIFETERLTIRPTALEDATFIFELFNSPKWLQFIGDRKIRSVENAKNYISNRMHPQLKKLGFSNYTVIRKSDNLKIGTCGLYDREGLNGIDIGFAFLPEFEKQGFAFEATSVILKAAKDDFDIEELNAITLEKNTGSRKLLEKLGFDFKERIRIPDDPEELFLYHLKL